MLKLGLIVDKNEAYINFQKKRLLKKWDPENLAFQNISNLSETNNDSLFGDTMISILRIDNLEDLKKFIKTLETLSHSKINELATDGFIFITTVPRTSTKKIEAFFKDNDGEICVPITADDKNPLPIRLINDLKVSPEVKEFMISYTGEDYDVILPIVEGLMELPANALRKITSEDIYARLPTPPGSVQPWTVETAIMEGKLTNAIDFARRVNSHSSYLLWLSILKKKMLTYYEVSLYYKDDPSCKDDKIVKELKLNPKSFYFTKKTVKAHNFDNFQKALELIAEAEGKVKGNSSVKGSSLMEILIVRLVNIFKG